MDKPKTLPNNNPAHKSPAQRGVKWVNPKTPYRVGLIRFQLSLSGQPTKPDSLIDLG